ncbi:MAG: RNA 3'-terminal phosphate cyclase, partial [Pirellulaceae bacterium]
ADLHSSRLVFAPGVVQTRGFRFDVGSAGSATLVAQTVLPALMLADGTSSIEVTGGTHNMAAPPFDYLTQVYLPQVAKMGPRFSTAIHAWGFYPQGGGHIRVDITPAKQLRGLELMESGGAPVPRVTALVANLPSHIGERECDTIRRKAGWRQRDCHVQMIDRSPGPGNVVMIQLTYPNVTELFTGFGKKGVQAEQVAVQAWRQAKDFMAQDVPVGEFLADQLLLPLAIAASQGQTSRFRTGSISLHSRTHIDIIQRFLDVDIEMDPSGNQHNEISIGPAKSGVS